MTLRGLQLLLDLLDSSIEIVHQILLLSVLGLSLGLLLRSLVTIFDFLLQINDLLLVLLNDLLAEVRSLGQFLLNLFVVFEVFREIADHRLHFMVFEHQILSLL